MENIQKMRLSYSLQGWGQGGYVFLEILAFWEHTAYSLQRVSRLDVTMGLWKTPLEKRQVVSTAWLGQFSRLTRRAGN